MSTGRPTRAYIEALLKRLAENDQIEHLAVAVKMADHPAAHVFLSTADDATTRAMLISMAKTYAPKQPESDA